MWWIQYQWRLKNQPWSFDVKMTATHPAVWYAEQQQHKGYQHVILCVMQLTPEQVVGLTEDGVWANSPP